MASGKTHDRASKWVAIANGSVVGSLCVDNGQLVVLATVTTLATWAWGLFLSPDLDLAESPRGCNAKRRWGLLGAYWVPYGKTFKHRGLSHWLVVGTATRLVYGLWPLVLWAWESGNTEIVWFVFSCGCVSDATHLVLDYWR